MCFISTLIDKTSLTCSSNLAPKKLFTKLYNQSVGEKYRVSEKTVHTTIYCCTSFDKVVEKCLDTVLDFFKLKIILKVCLNIIQGTKLNAFRSTISTIMVVIVLCSGTFRAYSIRANNYKQIKQIKQSAAVYTKQLII